LEGKYWEESYTWPSNKNEYNLVKRESPFGFVELNLDGKPETSFHRFKPSVKIVDVNIDANNLDQGTVRARFKEVFDDIKGREDVKDLIVVPRVTGSSSFSVSLLRDIPSNYPALTVERIRDDTIQARSPFVAGGRVETIILTPEDLGKELLRNVAMIAKALREQGITVKPKDLKRLISHLLQEDLLEKRQKRVSNYIFEVLQKFSNELEKEELIESLPKDYSDFLRRRCEEAL
jgi:DNA-binding protein